MTEELARRLLEHLQHGTAHLGTIPDGFRCDWLTRYTFSPAQQDRRARMMGGSWTSLGSTRSYRI